MSKDKDIEPMKDQDPKLAGMEALFEYVKAVLFEVDISRIGYHGALRRRHEMLGDMQADFDKEFGEDIDA